jgi:hypothetical protein
MTEPENFDDELFADLYVSPNAHYFAQEMDSDC